MGKLYTIHEVAQTLGISADTIRLYEKEGLLEPIRNENNNYRYYDAVLIQRLMGICHYRRLGMSVADTKSVFGAESFDSVLEQINELIEKSEREYENLGAKLEKQRFIRDHIRLLSSNLNKYSIRDTNKQYIINNTSLEDITWPYIQSIISAPYFSYGHLSYLIQFDKKYEKHSTLVEFTVPETMAALFPDFIIENVTDIDDKYKAIYTVIISNKHDIDTYDFSQIFEYAQNNNYELTGKIRVIYSFSLSNGHSCTDFFEIFAEIR